MKTVLVTPGDLHGKVTAPGSKSYTQRALLISAFSSTPLILRNVAFCEDDMVSAEIARKCGIKV
ncbi:3-phosphoshikimate 1-carboxyvinyltransferase, core domain protein, partial [mine drainage metagenome]